MNALPESEQTASPTRHKLFLSPTQWFSAFIFSAVALWLVDIVPTTEIACMCVILVFTIYLFAFEVVGVDVAAITIMVLLGLSAFLAPLIGLNAGLIDNNNLFNGFSSNAVMSIVAIMIIGAGLDKTGIMNQVAAVILRVGGNTENRIIPIISASVGMISSFMQNVGAAALFIPVVSRISARTGLPMSRLLMPMGFTAILGGTMTMVGSSPLILLNDLIVTSNSSLADDQQMQTFDLFSVTPIGLALVATGILYFVIAGRYILPATESESSTRGTDTLSYFQDVYGLRYYIAELVVVTDSPLIGKTLEDIEQKYRIRIIAIRSPGNSNHIGPGTINRDTTITSTTILGVVADPDNIKHFAEVFELKQRRYLRTFADDLSAAKSGIAEVVIPPGSSLIGKSARDVWLRSRYGLALIGLHRHGETKREGDEIRDMPFMAGDTLVVHTAWNALQRIESDKDFVVVTTEYPHEELRPQKVGWALLFFCIALSLVLFTDTRLSIALLTGAIGMVLSGVLQIEEAYNSVSWKTVFLLASLIPLGIAVETTGTARWIAEQVLLIADGMPIWVIQFAIAVLATFFTLVMSNVGATVLLVPLAVNIALGIDANPAMFALTVAIATSNSFIIPTHQVNALIMGPAGYRVADFIRAGSIMTLLFLIVSTAALNLFY